MVRSRKRRPCNRKMRERAKPPLKSHPAHATTFRAREAVSCICIVYDPASTGQAGQGASRTMRIPANASVVGIISSRSILMWAGRDGGSLRPVGWGGAHPIPSVVCCPHVPPPPISVADIAWLGGAWYLPAGSHWRVEEKEESQKNWK